MNMRGLPGGTGNIAASRETLYAVMSYVLRSYMPNDTDSLIRAIVKQYPDMNSTVLTPRTKATSQAMTDSLFMEPVNYEASMHSRSTKKAGTGKKTFLYNFKYRPSFVHYADWVTGSHTDDHYLLFGEDYRRKLRESKLGNFSQTDRFVGDSMVKYFTNFAYSGDPNIGPHTVPAPWPQFETMEKNYIELGSQMASRQVDKDLQRRIDFWRNEWPKITIDNERRKIHLLEQSGSLGFKLMAELAAEFMISMGSEK